jgi:hypothetical protein
LVLLFCGKSRTTLIETNEREKKQSDSALVLLFFGKMRKETKQIPLSYCYFWKVKQPYLKQKNRPNKQ